MIDTLFYLTTGFSLRNIHEKQQKASVYKQGYTDQRHINNDVIIVIYYNKKKHIYYK